MRHLTGVPVRHDEDPRLAAHDDYLEATKAMRERARLRELRVVAGRDPETGGYPKGLGSYRYMTGYRAAINDFAEEIVLAQQRRLDREGADHD